MATFSNTRTVRIEWGDCDPAGIIFFPNYFRIFDHSTAMLFETVLGMSKFEMFKTLEFTGWPLVRTPPEQRDNAAIAAAVRKCGEMLAAPDATLRERSFLGANEFTMGDIPLGCHLQLWMRLPIDRPKLPGLEAWFARLCERPAYRRIVDIALS